MNAKRRKELQKISGLLSEAYARLEEIKDEENECFDNIPENLQGSERYNRAEEIVGLLDEAFDNIEEAISNIDKAVE